MLRVVRDHDPGRLFADLGWAPRVEMGRGRSEQARTAPDLEAAQQNALELAMRLAGDRIAPVTRSEQTRRGLARARAAGRRLGRPPVLTGEQVARVRELRAQGASWAEISDVVGCSIGTARRAAR